MSIKCCRLWHCIPSICVFTLSDCKRCIVRQLHELSLTCRLMYAWIACIKIAMVANVSMFRELSPGVIGPEFWLQEVDMFDALCCAHSLHEFKY